MMAPLKNLQTPAAARSGVLWLIALLLFHTQVNAQSHYWQQEVKYIIDVTLNDKDQELDGFEKIMYTNHSPDTLTFIWFHIWPNAFKNDRTAFSEQLLKNGRTDFYFSDKEHRGYINRLDFKVNGTTADVEDHPQHIDVIKLLLPKPLLPGDSVDIQTPFHIKLPWNFSRGGYRRESFQITQWYPKPAVYDRKGWHPMPYLDQGEFYSDFASYDVSINIPSDYVVAATGLLKEESLEPIKVFRQNKGVTTTATHTSHAKQTSKQSPKGQTASGSNSSKKAGSKQTAQTKVVRGKGTVTPKSKGAQNTLSETQQNLNRSATDSIQIKRLRFVQDRVVDFAWFADKRFIVRQDTLMQGDNKVIQLYSYTLPEDSSKWKNSLFFMKRAIQTRNAWLGNYPYETLSIVEAEMGFEGGMEYPTITSISPMDTEKEIDLVIQHEIGHNWFYGILASNERKHPWMDEGMNSFYDERYASMFYPDQDITRKSTFRTKRLPEQWEKLGFETMASLKKDQPIETPSEDFTENNYALVAYYKTSAWLKALESYLGAPAFDSAMKLYFNTWKFRHPYPEDFKTSLEVSSGRDLDTMFQLLELKGGFHETQRKKIKLAGFFNLKDTDKNQYISLAPLAGFNWYDGLMVGVMIHNYQLPLPKFRFFVTPLYGTKSGSLNGLAHLSYNWLLNGKAERVEFGSMAARFTQNDFMAEQGMLRLSYLKLAPFVKVFLKQPVSSATKKWFEVKLHVLREEELEFKEVISGTDTSDVAGKTTISTSIADYKFVFQNDRVLYPYKGELKVQQHQDFLRASFTGEYFLNYAKHPGGIKIRMFAGKFMYTGVKNTSKQFATDRYHLTLSGAKGYEDFTYSNYFAGRNEFEKWPSQQIMIRDGGFKVGTDLLDAKVGKTDNWLLATNLRFDVPSKYNPLHVLPVKIPLKVFVDIGSYAEAWEKNAETNRFLFDAGFQFSFFKDVLNIYVPVLYSRVYKDYFRSTLGDKRFLKTITFSIDLQEITLKKISRNLSF